MSAADLWAMLDALPWPAPWTAAYFAIDCPCPNGASCGEDHSCATVEAREAYPSSPDEPAEEGEGQCVVQISTPGLEMFAKPCAEFIAAARNELPAIRSAFAEKDRRIAELEAALSLLWEESNDSSRLSVAHDLGGCLSAELQLSQPCKTACREALATDATKDTDRPKPSETPNRSRGAK